MRGMHVLRLVWILRRHSTCMSHTNLALAPAMRTRTSTLRVPRTSLEIFMGAGILQLDAPQLGMRRTQQIAWYCIWYPGVWYGGRGTTAHKRD